MPKFSIRFNPGRSSKKPFQLDLGMVMDPVTKRGRRQFLYFESKAGADKEKGKRLAEVKQYGTAALGFTEAQRLRYAEADGRLRKVGATIEEAVEFWERHHARIVDVVSVAELVERGKVAMARYQSKQYLGAMGVAWRSFAERYGQMEAGAVTSEEVTKWLRAREWALKTKKNYLSDLSMLFDWGAHPERGLVAVNPCAKVELRGRVEKEEVTCMTPAQAKKLMETTMEKYPDFLGYVALGLFAGIRPKRERRGLTIDDIAAAAGEASPVVAVGARIAKGASRGTTGLSENLVAWLRKWQELCPGQKNVWPEHWEPRWIRLRMEAGWEIPWPRNLERHTFASMHYAAHHNLGLLKAALRHHGSEHTLHNHYKAVRMLDGQIVTGAAAAEFWAIRP